MRVARQAAASNDSPRASRYDRVYGYFISLFFFFQSRQRQSQGHGGRRTLCVARGCGVRGVEYARHCRAGCGWVVCPRPITGATRNKYAPPGWQAPAESPSPVDARTYGHARGGHRTATAPDFSLFLARSRRGAHSQHRRTPPPAHTARRPRYPPHTDELPPYGYELARPNHGLPTTKAVPCGAQPASRPTAPPPPPPCSPTLHPRGGTCTSTHSGHRLLPGRPALPRDVIDPADGTAAGRGCGAWGAERAGADCAQAGVWRRVGR